MILKEKALNLLLTNVREDLLFCFRYPASKLKIVYSLFEICYSNSDKIHFCKLPHC